jgi:hypothetical protein
LSRGGRFSGRACGLNFILGYIPSVISGFG